MNILNNLILPFSGSKYTEEPIVIERGEGAYLYDVKGKKYLDGFSSLWVSILGHRHPEIDKAIIDQVRKVSHVTLYGQAHLPAIELTNELLDFLDLPDYHILYSNSGSEAVEAAVKIAINYTKRTNENPKKRKIVTFKDSYHGETGAAMSVSGFDSHQADFPTLVLDKIEASSPISTKINQRFDSPEKQDFETIVENLGDEIAAVIIEPVYGAAGILFPSQAFFKNIEKICKERGFLLIVDEVATGFYRTGAKFCFQDYGIKPDIVVLGKALAAGYLPLSATIVSPEIGNDYSREDDKQPLHHGHTFAGNPLACAASRANLEVLKRPAFKRDLSTLIAHFNSRIGGIVSHNIAEVRHRGIFAGIEFYDPKKTKVNWNDVAHRTCNDLKTRGVLLRPLGNTIVLAPPAVSRNEDIDLLFETLHESIKITDQRLG